MCVVPVMPVETPAMAFFTMVMPLMSLPRMGPVLPVTSFGAAIELPPAARYRQLTVPTFRVPAIFSAESGPATEEIATPPRGTEKEIDSPGGGGGSGGNGKAGRVSYRDLFHDLKADLPEIRTAAQLIARLEDDIEKCADVENKLGYIGDVAFLLEASEGRFGPAGLIEVSHRLAQKADELTGYLTPTGFTTRVPVNIHNNVKPLFRISVDMERKLLEANELKQETTAWIADIHSVHARKGLYFYAMNGEKTDIQALELTVLVLLDAVKRFEVLGLGGNAEKAQTFLREVQKRHFLPPVLWSWAMVRLEKEVNTNIAALAEWKGDQDIFDSLWEPLRLAWNDTARGIYVYSPQMLKKISDAFGRHGLQDLSSQYAARANSDRAIAQKLGIFD